MVKDYSNKSERLKNNDSEKAAKPVNQNLVAFLVAVCIFGGIWLIAQQKNKASAKEVPAPMVQAESEKKPQITMDIDLPKKS